MSSVDSIHCSRLICAHDDNADHTDADGEEEG